ncbi:MULTISPECIES: hypothetical protein [Aureimonas]|uniref:Uncharacterized protein n=2 Tax=Aureimonas TaxID=414371 RepID=A0A1H0HDU6_9HYPH|nr:MULTISPECIES: hypothetical protein [Aureimonas]MBB3934647.1 hypothetical protein [Aureimonas phyllosphaerae]MBB3950542.1 hypothetical protein [Aureimonas jatrophae]MBB3958137.1 hypothetical protein [Aureimonas phyllosphaerae]SDO17318.1 hypothetical protein SAMN05192530_10451 [Aureimonas jatrophae]SFE92416.1 hypothetical protein SAMN05216566_101108 [Aureimonas phyllosphaerae]
MQTPYETDTGRIADGLPASFESSSVPGADTFNHPDQVVSAAGLTKSQKRMLLASWASDRRTVEDKPSLRRLDSGAVIPIDEILEAMTALDRDGELAASGTADSLAARRTNRLVARLVRRRPTPWTDRNDDPPPSAAAAARPFSPIFTEALARSA